MWDITIHLIQGPASSRALVSFSNRCGTPPNPHHSGPSVRTSTSPHVYPLRGTVSSLTHRWCLALIPFVTIQVHREQILSSLGFPFRAYPDFKICLLGRSFHTLIKGVSFSSPTNVGYHIWVREPIN